MSISFHLFIVLVIILSAGCGGSEGGNKAYSNPQWRENVAATVNFPLSEPVTLRMGVPDSSFASLESNLSLQWIEKQTNITIAFEEIPQSPGDYELGQIYMRGDFYDLVPEYRINLKLDSFKNAFVDFREFPGLLPNVRALASEDERFRNGLIAKLVEDGSLLSLGSYDPDLKARVGSLMYRRDLFVKHDLDFGTWNDLAGSFRKLKKLYPQSYPFGVLANDLYYVLPSLFGTGLNSSSLVYYDPDRDDWFFGPFEEKFRKYLEYIAGLYADGLILPDAFTMGAEEAARTYITDTVFVFITGQASGPHFTYKPRDYGGLTDEGLWDGTDVWFEAMPLPEVNGGRPRLVPDLFSYVGSGCLVYTQGQHVGEAIALLDFLYSGEAAIELGLGPEGTIWSQAGTRISLKQAYAEAYDANGKEGISELAQENGIHLFTPLPGLQMSAMSLFGVPGNPSAKYLNLHDLAFYRGGIEIPEQRGFYVEIDRETQDLRDSIIGPLQIYLHAELERFMFGKRPFDEYSDFIEGCRQHGAEELLELYRARTVRVTEPLFG